jgi:hypothetical protein
MLFEELFLQKQKATYVSNVNISNGHHADITDKKVKGMKAEWLLVA